MMYDCRPEPIANRQSICDFELVSNGIVYFTGSIRSEIKNQQSFYRFFLNLMLTQQTVFRK